MCGVSFKCFCTANSHNHVTVCQDLYTHSRELQSKFVQLLQRAMCESESHWQREMLAKCIKENTFGLLEKSLSGTKPIIFCWAFVQSSWNKTDQLNLLTAMYFYLHTRWNFAFLLFTSRVNQTWVDFELKAAEKLEACECAAKEEKKSVARWR